MRWLVMAALALASAGPARALDIADVLRASQQKRLDSLPPAPEGPRADAVRRSFAVLRGALPQGTAVDLRVVAGPVVAETLHGHIVVANVALADLDEGERLFVLAHELGHVVAAHWLRMGLVYARWVPGEVTPERTDPVAGALAREAGALAHEQEFEADAFALGMLHALGRPAHHAWSAFRRLGAVPDSPTHPATRRRVAALRAAAESSGHGDAD
jgi:Peptidase family M48